MRRVFAVLGALFMVILALLIRAQLDDDGDGGGGGGDDGDRVALLCAEELADVCRALEAEGVATVEIEPVGTTVDRLGAEGRLDADAWLTLAPFPEIVDLRREQATLTRLFGDVESAGWSTPLAMVAYNDRAAALEEDCPEVGWACLGNIASDEWSDHHGQGIWGPVRPGYDPPDTSATGLLVLAQAMAEHLERNDFALQDIDSGWLRGLERGVANRPPGHVLDQYLVLGAPAFAAVGALGTDATSAAGTARGEDLTIFYPAPMFRAEVVLAGQADLEGLDDALGEAGWDRGEDGDALPTPGALDALRTAWEEVS